MYFFYLVVNTVGVCTSNNSKTDINCPPLRHWGLILSRDVPLAGSGYPEPKATSRETQSALLSSLQEPALEGRAGRKRRRREGQWDLLSFLGAHAAPARVRAMGVGIDQSSPRAHQVVSSTLKPMLKRENLVMIISNLIFLLGEQTLSSQTTCYLQRSAYK